MMLEDAFFRSHKCRVEVHHGNLGAIGFGELTFGNGEWPALHLEQSLAPLKLIDGEAYPKLTATTQSGEILLLIDCVVHGRSVFAEAVVEGDLGENFQAVAIRLANVSEWLLRGTPQVASDGGPLETDDNPGPIDVDIRVDGQSFSLRTATVANRGQGGDTEGKAYVRFAFKPHEGRFGMDDARAKSRELAGLMSLLLAQPVDVETVWVMGDDDCLRAAYFPHFERKQELDRGWFIPRCLIQPGRLNGRWQEVIENYYRSPYRSVAWARMAGMLRYDGFWEYRVVGYFSMLDSMLEQKASVLNTPRSPPSRRKIAELRRRAGHLPEPLTQGQLDRVTGIVEEIFSRSDSVKARYDVVAKASDSRVMSVIDISSDDLETMTEIRHQVAHGDALELPQGGPGALMRLVDKVVVLLTYWAYIDLGLSDETFLRCLDHSNNLLLHDGRIDRVFLERTLGTATFYEVSAERFESLSAIKTIRTLACFTRDRFGEVDYSERYTSMLEAWQHAGAGAMTPEAIFGLPSTDVTFSPKAYVECGKRRLELHWIYLIERERPVPE